MKTLILYWADNCIYCKNYLPEWEKLKDILKDHNIETLDYEKSRDWSIVSKELIITYPTIKYINEKGEKEVLKKRSIDFILNHLNIKIQKDDSDNYFNFKYLKYKNKYLKLKNKNYNIINN